MEKEGYDAAGGGQGAEVLIALAGLVLDMAEGTDVGWIAKGAAFAECEAAVLAA